jgi:hypothetical protein
MSQENPLWGAPRIRGELLKLGFELAESTVSKYMIRRQVYDPPASCTLPKAGGRSCGTMQRRLLRLIFASFQPGVSSACLPL